MLTSLRDQRAALHTAYNTLVYTSQNTLQVEHRCCSILARSCRILQHRPSLSTASEGVEIAPLSPPHKGVVQCIIPESCRILKTKLPYTRLPQAPPRCRLQMRIIITRDFLNRRDCSSTFGGPSASPLFLTSPHDTKSILPPRLILPLIS